MSTTILAELSPILVMDCDNTLAYYPKENDFASGLYHHDDLIHFPPSSGNGIVGYVSNITNSWLEKLRQHGIILICASGMREATMRSRQSSLPAIQYWICETGGKIFQTTDAGGLEEFHAWKQFIDTEDAQHNSVAELHALQHRLVEEGKVKVDCNGYETMIRISSASEADVEDIIRSLPLSLKYTFNLGYLDVQLSCCGKYSSVQWLVRHLSGDFRHDSNYLYMGDDDNDIEICSHARVSLIANPCSANMRKFVNNTLMEPISGKVESLNSVFHNFDNAEKLADCHLLNDGRVLIESKRTIFKSSEGLLEMAYNIFLSETTTLLPCHPIE
jgi:hydroxymethylpyrimidine pyrophosphatase-like HAD family hydrolase